MIQSCMRYVARAGAHWRAATAVGLSIGAVVAGAGTGSAAVAPITGPIYGYQGLCMDDRGFGTSNGNPVQLYQCNNGSNQQWTVTNPTFGSTTTFTDLGLCLGVEGDGSSNGDPAGLYTCDGSAVQEWILEFNGTFVNLNSGKCLDDTGFGLSGTALEVWDCNNGSNQVWNISGLPTG